MTSDSPKGSFDGANRNFTIYANDQLTEAAPWNNVVIAYKNGAPVRVRDIGQAIDGPENAKSKAFNDGKTAVFLPVYQIIGKMPL